MDNWLETKTDSKEQFNSLIKIQNEALLNEDYDLAEQIEIFLNKE